MPSRSECSTARRAHARQHKGAAVPTHTLDIQRKGVSGPPLAGSDASCWSSLRCCRSHFNSLLRTTRLDSRAETLLTWYVALIRAGCPQDKQIHYARELRQARDALNPALPRPLLTAVVRAHLEARGDYNPPARPLDFSPDVSACMCLHSPGPQSPQPTCLHCC